MHLPRSLASQAIITLLVGATSGAAYKHYAQADSHWNSTHYRLDERATFSLGSGLPFSSQFFMGARGERIDVPSPKGVELDYGSATWWSIEETGRMHLWDANRIEVYPVLQK